MRAYGANNPEEAKKAHKARNRRPFADLDPMADVKEAPQYLRRQGTRLEVATKQASPGSRLSRAQAAQRLARMCGEAWAANPTACNDLIRRGSANPCRKKPWRSWLKPLRPVFTPRARQWCCALTRSRGARHARTELKACWRSLKQARGKRARATGLSPAAVNLLCNGRRLPKNGWPRPGANSPRGCTRAGRFRKRLRKPWPKSNRSPMRRQLPAREMKI